PRRGGPADRGRRLRSGAGAQRRMNHQEGDLHPYRLYAISVQSRTSSRPLHLGWHAGQDRLDIAARLQPEHGAAVVEQVEFDVAAAADELFLAVRLRPVLVEVPTHEVLVHDEEGAADILHEGEVGVPAALLGRAFQPVEEDAADAARLVAVRQEEILVAPGLEAGM